MIEQLAEDNRFQGLLASTSHFHIQHGEPMAQLTALQLEFMNQLEQAEAKSYGIFGRCNYWIKRYINKKIMIECDERLITEEYGQFDHKLELAENERIRYMNLMDPEIIVIYTKPDQNIIKQVSSRFDQKNIILRFIFEECQGLNISYQHIWQGIGIHLQVNHIGDLPEFQKDYLWRTIHHKYGTNHQSVLYWKSQVIKSYQGVMLQHIMQSGNLTDVVTILQNHPNLDYGDYSKIKANNTGAVVPPTISSAQFMKVNYQVIMLNEWTNDPLYLDKHMKRVIQNTRILKQHTDNYDTLDYNLNTYAGYTKQQNLPFQPPIGKDKQAFITITNVLTDKRTKYYHSYDHINTAEYKQKLNIGNNFIQVYLIIDINSSAQQQKLLQALKNLHAQQVSMQIHLTLTSSNHSDQARIKQIYSCLMNIYQYDQTKSLSVLEQLISSKNGKQVSQLCRGTLIGGIDQIVQKSINICELQNICHYPLLIVNDHVINQVQLLDYLEHNSIKKIELALKDIIQERAQAAYQLMKSKNAFNPTEFANYHFKNSFQDKTSVVYSYASANHIDIYENAWPKAYLKTINYDNSLQNLDILITIYSLNKEFIYEFSTWVNILKYNYRIELVILGSLSNQIELKGYLPLGRDSYIFLNGVYIPLIQSQWQLEQLVEIEYQKLNYLRKDLTLNSDGQRLMTDINYMGIIKDIIDKTDEIDAIVTQFPHQSLVMTHQTKNEKSDEKPNEIFLKLTLLSKESVVVLSYLHSIDAPMELVTTFFLDFQLNNKVYDFPYHYYRLIWERNISESIVLDNLNFKYPRIIVNVDSLKFNFGIKKLSHYRDFFDEESNSNNIMGAGYTLDFVTQSLKELDENVEIKFELNMVQNIGEIFYTQSELGHSMYSHQHGSGTDIFTVMDAYDFIEQRPNIDGFTLLQAPKLGRFYVYKEGSNEIIKVDFDSSIYQEKSYPLRFNVNYKQDQVITGLQERQLQYTNLYALKKLSDQTFLQFYFIATGPLYETLLLTQIYQLVTDINGKQKISIFIMENTWISPQFKQGLQSIHNQHPIFEYHLLNLKWPHMIYYQPKEFYKQILFFKVLFTDQVIPLNTHGKILLKDADQCLGMQGVNWNDLFDFDQTMITWDEMPIGMITHGNEGVGRDAVLTDIKLFSLWDKQEYYCGAIIMTDIDKMRRLKTGEVIRKYYNELETKHNQVDTLPLIEQGFINVVNRDFRIIYKLSDEWLWSEDFRTQQSKKIAKNIDLQAIQNKNETKLQQAFRVCPGYQQDFNRLKQLLK